MSAARTASRSCASSARFSDIVVSQLGELGPLATVPAADGAFYCLLRVQTDMPPLALAERLIREHKVAVIPGTAFGMRAAAISAWRTARCRRPRWRKASAGW